MAPRAYSTGYRAKEASFAPLTSPLDEIEDKIQPAAVSFVENDPARHKLRIGLVCGGASHKSSAGRYGVEAGVERRVQRRRRLGSRLFQMGLGNWRRGLGQQ